MEPTKLEIGRDAIVAVVIIATMKTFAAMRILRTPSKLHTHSAILRSWQLGVNTYQVLGHVWQVIGWVHKTNRGVLRLYTPSSWLTYHTANIVLCV